MLLLLSSVDCPPPLLFLDDIIAGSMSLCSRSSGVCVSAVCQSHPTKAPPTAQKGPRQPTAVSVLSLTQLLFFFFFCPSIRFDFSCCPCNVTVLCFFVPLWFSQTLTQQLTEHPFNGSYLPNGFAFSSTAGGFSSLRCKTAGSAAPGVFVS